MYSGTINGGRSWYDALFGPSFTSLSDFNLTQKRGLFKNYFRILGKNLQNFLWPYSVGNTLRCHFRRKASLTGKCPDKSGLKADTEKTLAHSAMHSAGFALDSPMDSLRRTPYGGTGLFFE